MDNTTIETYNREAESISALHSNLIPTRIYELIQNHFIPFEKTADIGCGAGRDTYWLNQQGFDVVGIDASHGMLKKAKSQYPDIRFIEDFLPELSQLKTNSLQNILCSAVLMHINQEKIFSACLRLIELLKPNGCLIISFRETKNEDFRENGKLYENIQVESLIIFFKRYQCDIILHESTVEQTRGLTWQTIVIKKARKSPNL